MTDYLNGFGMALAGIGYDFVRIQLSLWPIGFALLMMLALALTLTADEGRRAAASGHRWLLVPLLAPFKVGLSLLALELMPAWQIAHGHTALLTAVLVFYAFCGVFLLLRFRQARSLAFSINLVAAWLCISLLLPSP